MARLNESAAPCGKAALVPPVGWMAPRRKKHPCCIARTPLRARHSNRSLDRCSRAGFVVEDRHPHGLGDRFGPSPDRLGFAAETQRLTVLKDEADAARRADESTQVEPAHLSASVLIPVLNDANCVWLKVLKLSARNCTLTRSLILVVLYTEMSH